MLLGQEATLPEINVIVNPESKVDQFNKGWTNVQLVQFGAFSGILV